MLSFRPLPARACSTFCSLVLYSVWTLVGCLLTVGPLGLGSTEHSQCSAQEPSAESNTEPVPPTDAATEPKAEPATSETQPPADSVIALVGGRVLTMSDAGEIAVGTVLIRNQKIDAVGTDVTIPEGARVIDLQGMVITPGLIDLRSPLWMSAETIQDPGSTGALDAADALDPYDNAWKEVAQQGVTSTYAQPYSTGILGGYGVATRVHPGEGDVETVLRKREAGFQSSLGVGTNGQSSRAKIGEMESLKKRFADAKEYSDQWKKYREYEAEQAKKKAAEEAAKNNPQRPAGPPQPAPGAAGTAPAAGTTPGTGEGPAGGDVTGGEPRRGFRRGNRGGGPPVPNENRPVENPPAENKPTENKPAENTPADAAAKPAASSAATDPATAEKKEEAPKKPKFDPLKERLVRLLDGSIPLRLEAHRGDDLKRALELAKEFNLTMVLEGLSNLGSGVASVQSSNLPIVLGPWLDGEQNAYHSADRTTQWANAFANYPGQLAIATFGQSARSSTDLRAHAAAAVAAGFDPQRVLQAITTVPATLIGEGTRLGKIQPGYDADLAVFVGDPLDPATAVRMTIVAGKIVAETSVDPTAVEPTPSDSFKLSVWENQPQNLPTTYAIRSTHVMQSDGTWQPSMLQIADGKLVAVHPLNTTLDSLPIYDAGESFVTPGLVTAHANLAPALWNDRQELSDSGSVRAADVFDPLAPVVKSLIKGGFLRAAHSPGNTRVIAGQTSELRLGSAASVVAPELAELFVISASSRNRERFPSSLAGQIQLVAKALSGEVEASPLFLPKSALAALEKAQLRRRSEIIAGQRRAILNAEVDAETAAALKIARQFQLTGALLGADQLEPIIQQLIDAKIDVIARPSRASDYQWYIRDLVAASARGVRVGFAGSDPLLVRQTAAEAVREGMPRSTAMLALTSTAAAVSGMSPSAGQLAIGAEADFVVWNGSPLNLAARPLAIIVDGKLVDTDN